MTRRNATLIDELDADPTARLGLAAARLAVRVEALLSAMKRASGLSQREIADRAGVTEGRVSQVLNGDGNVRIASLARFARAMGYTITISAEPAEGAAALPGHRRIRKAASPKPTESRTFRSSGAGTSFPVNRLGIAGAAGVVNHGGSTYRADFALAAFKEIDHAQV